MMPVATHRIGCILPRLRPGLDSSLLVERYNAQLAAAPRLARTFNGKRAVKPAGAHDPLILEVRRLYEQVGLPPRAILDEITRHGYPRTLAWVRQTTNYYNRSHLVPVLGAASYLPALPNPTETTL